MRRALLLQELTFALLILAVVSGAITLWLQARRDTRLTMQGQQAHAALCVFKLDMQARMEMTRRFLRDHPRGFDGLTISVIEQSLKSEEATYYALSTLTCPKGAP